MTDENDDTDPDIFTGDRDPLCRSQNFPAPNNCALAWAHAEPRTPVEQAIDGTQRFKEVVAVFNFTENDFGFGEVRIVADPVTGQHYIDGESMSRERIKKYLGWLVDSAVMDTDQDPERHQAYDKFMRRQCTKCPAPVDDPIPGE